MSSGNSQHDLSFEKPGKYRINVLGKLAASWSERLGGMVITTSTTQDGQTVSSLVGHLRDQAQLSGVLNSLYDLHFPILLVEYLIAENEAD